MAEYCWNLRPLLMVETTHFNERMIFFPCSFSAEKSTAEREEYKSVEKTGATTVYAKQCIPFEKNKGHSAQLIWRSNVSL